MPDVIAPLHVGIRWVVLRCNPFMLFELQSFVTMLNALITLTLGGTFTFFITKELVNMFSNVDIRSVSYYVGFSFAGVLFLGLLGLMFYIIFEGGFDMQESIMSAGMFSQVYTTKLSAVFERLFNGDVDRVDIKLKGVSFRAYPDTDKRSIFCYTPDTTVKVKEFRHDTGTRHIFLHRDWNNNPDGSM